MHTSLRTVTVPSFICPSDPYPNTFQIAEGEGFGHGHEHEEGDGPEHVDEGDKLFAIGKSNYVGMFGTFELEDAHLTVTVPSLATAARSSATYAMDLAIRSLSVNAMGDWEDRFGTALLPRRTIPRRGLWVWPTMHPIHAGGHFEDFRSYHPGGVNFLRADGSVRMYSQTMNEAVYKGMATIAGGEVISEDSL